MPLPNAAESKMKHNAFESLHELCEAHPHIFTHASSPTAEELETFEREFRRTSYVIGMMADGHVAAAIKKLEAGLKMGLVPAARPPDLPDEAWRNYPDQKRQEREVRFLHRLAVIAGPVEKPMQLYGIGKEADKQKKAAAALRKADKALSAIWKNEKFVASVLPASSQNILAYLRKNLDAAASIVDQVRVEYPYKRARNKSTAQSIQMIDRVSDSCFRIYAYCDKAILEHLAQCEWLNREINDVDWVEIMKAALARKIGQYERRIPKEDYVEAGLLGKWLPIAAEWAPAINLNPPWMQA
jgi:hypothetical protein